MRIRGSFIKVICLGILLAIALLNIYILLSGRLYIYRAFYYNVADIDDYKIFPGRKIAHSSHPQPWPLAESYNRQRLSPAFLSRLEHTGSVAFLLLKRDSLVYEHYWDGYSDSTISNPFSVSKSIVSALIGIAIREGKIKSVDQPVYEFMPSFADGSKRKITIKHLLTMSSGLKWNESYLNPFSVTTEAYYGKDLPHMFENMETERNPGEEFEYKSGNTQLLGFILEKAGGQSLSAYAQEKLWEPLGAEHNALWSLDKAQGHEKAYCCFNTDARDLLRLGSLYLHQGNWKGRQLMDTPYVGASLTPASILYEHKPIDFYGYQWWLIPSYKGKKIFYARGIWGQIVMVIPELEIVAVRLGKKRGGKTGLHYSLVFDIAGEIMGVTKDE